MNDSIYREVILEEYKQPRNKGRLEAPTHTSHVTNPLCGDEVTLNLNVQDGVVKDVRFDGAGCAISQASASLFTEHIKGRRVEEVMAMDEQEMLSLLGFTLNAMRMKCAVLIMRATAEALNER